MNIYEYITDAIIAQLEQGEIPWRKPWTGSAADCAVSHATGKPYSLLNQLFLRPGEYITFKQCRDEGGRVKEGAKAKTVVFWKVLQSKLVDADGHDVTDADGNLMIKTIPVLKYYHVFHIDDCEGITPRFSQENAEPSAVSPIGRADDVLADYVRREGIRLEIISTNDAYYRPADDLIHLPQLSQFADPAEYYSTAFHEATHSTGHASRLNRFTPENFTSREEYSKEELVAEIGSACILHQLGIETPGSFRNSAAYIQGWLRALQDDKRLIVSAASRAEKAVNRIMEPTDAITLDDLAVLVA